MGVRERRTRAGKGSRRAPGAALAPVQWHDPRWNRDGEDAQPAGARIVHHVPGRLRLRFDGIADSEFFDALHELLSALPGVTSVRVNAAACSAVVHYDPEQQRGIPGIESHPALKELLEDSGVPEGSRQEEALLERGITYLEHHSQLAEALVTAAERVDCSLRRASDGYLDLKVLFPITMAAFSTLHKARSKGTPMWMTLCTFAFNTFMSLHRHRLDSPSSQQMARSTLAAR